MVELIARSLDARVDPLRLAAIARLGLLERTRDEVFDRASRLAARLLGADMALVSIVTDEEQRFIGATGLDAPGTDPALELERRTPLSHSFCQYVVRDDGPLVVHDAPSHPLVADNLAIPDLGVQAYLGVPIRDGAGHVLGSFCVLERRPRVWTDEELDSLTELAELVRTELLLRDHLEQLEHAAQAREDLLRTVSHDLRAAMSGVTGAARTLEADRGFDAATRTELLGVLSRQSDRAEGLLTTLLDRAAATGARTSRIRLDVAVGAAVATARAALGAGDRVATRLRPVLVDDRAGTVERITLNLVRNALQHTGGDVVVETGLDEDLAVVAVRDHGPGLPSWLLAGDLAEAALSGRASGHGIGVFSCVVLARSLDGQLTVETGPEGTTFRLLLPRAASR